MNECLETRTRYTEDIPKDIKPVVTEHIIHWDWCSECQKKVEPVVTEALPNCTLGNRVLTLTAWLHYSLGNTLSQIIDVFNFHLALNVTSGGLLAMWYRLQEVLYPWCQQIHTEALQSAVLHADETGWRVHGKTHWLWCFANDSLSFFLIDRSRGSPALEQFFLEEFQGTLGTDFWAAYNAVCCDQRQTGLVHLLRDIQGVDNQGEDGDWPDFSKKDGWGWAVNFGDIWFSESAARLVHGAELAALNPAEDGDSAQWIAKAARLLERGVARTKEARYFGPEGHPWASEIGAALASYSSLRDSGTDTTDWLKAFKLRTTYWCAQVLGGAELFPPKPRPRLEDAAALARRLPGTTNEHNQCLIISNRVYV